MCALKKNHRVSINISDSFSPSLSQVLMEKNSATRKDSKMVNGNIHDE